MTELSPLGTLSPPDRPAVFGSCGVLAPNTRGLVVDPKTGEALPPGQKGELLIAGPQVRAGPRRTWPCGASYLI